MNQIPTELFPLLSLMTKILVKEAPGMGIIMEKAKGGQLSEAEAFQEMVKLVESTPGLKKRLESMAGPLQTRMQTPQQNMLFQPKPKGLPGLNPLFVGALAEKLQFDGDIPELRTGPLPEGVSPAVPVDTDARNPVALGMMLGQASEEVKTLIEQHETERRTAIEAVAASDGTNLSLLKKHADLVAAGPNAARDVALWGSQETDMPSYRRGMPVPARQVTTPQGKDIATVAKERAKEMTWKFFSTTAGRRTVVHTIGMLVSKRLAEQGIHAAWKGVGKSMDGEVVAAHLWKVNLSGPGNSQENFAMVDTAAAALAVGLLRKLGDQRPEGLQIEVSTVDAVADREVGWEARLVAPKPKACLDFNAGAGI